MSGFLNPTRCCDLVMKGGITSGIVYPPAICRIAERFFLVGIGGTSAGAIAACVAAAAEYRRRCRNDGAGFEILEQMPHELASGGNLTALFRPDGSTRKTFELFLDVLNMGRRGWLGRTWLKGRIAWSVLRGESRLRPVIDNGFGLCTGMANDNPPAPGEIAPLTEWLAEQIDTVAGKDDGKPLTFGDLRNAPIPPSLEEVMVGEASRSIDLRMVTTCLSFGRPYELPFKDKVFAFDPKEWERLFPAKVMRHLLEESDRIDSRKLRSDGKLPLPVGDAMPVVVAARMSLSFPGLFTAVPLYAVNYHALERNGAYPMLKVYFSDGGITSNLPIHMFDSLFPRWPTLAINLQDTDKDGKPARETMGEALTYMIGNRSEGVQDLWSIFDGNSTATRDALGFALSIISSSQVWHDNAFLRLPSYRDRVVEIWLKPEEGGMNLTMSEATIRRLIERGDEAGVRIRNRFADSPPTDPLSWEGHRWTRLRSGLSGLLTYLNGFRHSVQNPMPGDRALDELLSNTDAAPTYKFDSQKRLTAARDAVNALLKCITEMQKTAVDSTEEDRPFHDHRPNPPVKIGSRAPM